MTNYGYTINNKNIMDYYYHTKLIFRSPLKPFKSSFNKKELTHLFLQKEVQEALFLSSPNLLDEYEKWRNGKINNEKKEEKLFYSLMKFALRMHNRCTPFGLFAGCNVVDFGTTNNIILDFENSKRSTRFDMNFMCDLVQNITQLPFVRAHLKFYPNSSIYHLKDKVRYVEYSYNNSVRIHKISVVDSSYYLKRVIKKSTNGEFLNELAQDIIDKDVILEEAYSFIEEMIDAQLLVSELEPSVTGEDLLLQTISLLIKIQEKHPNNVLEGIISVLKNTQDQLSKLDDSLGNEIFLYKNIINSLKLLNVPFELSKLFQTDLFISGNSKSTSLHDQGSIGMLDSDIQLQLTKTIKVLNRLTRSPVKTNLTEFKKNFYERYENKEIPLLEALDIETGIGYAQNNNHTGDLNPLINDLKIQYNSSSKLEINWDNLESFLLKKLLKAQRDNEYTVVIEPNELTDFKENWSDLPNTFSVMFKHLGERDGKNLLSIKSIGGSSATFLLGRFASNNKQIEDVISSIVEREEELSSNKILAEIVHLPESRTGNILMRPVFRDYEIPYLSRSTLPQKQQLALTDLYISIKNDQVYLRSKRLNKQIIPYLGNAHAFQFNALPVYHFLADLPSQNLRARLFFDWGLLQSEFRFLPRVEIENVIVSPATWQLEKDKFQFLMNRNEDILAIVNKWKEKLKIPDLIVLSEGDNELLINLKDTISVKMFISIIRKKSIIIIKEFLFDEKTAVIKDKEGNSYVNEFIAILLKDKVTLKESTENNEEEILNNSSGIQKKENHVELFQPHLVDPILYNEKLTKSFSLGSEWLYYKIYCGVKTSDKILIEIMKPLTHHLISQKLIDSWFFIRYSDPELHLRVRFHLVDINNTGVVIKYIQNAIAEYEKSRLIWKIQADTYFREIERYGNNSMIYSEQLFYYDSKCIVDMIDMIDGDEGEEIRWIFAIRAVDQLLLDFNYSNNQKMEIMENLKMGFYSEFNIEQNSKIQLDRKYRVHREVISNILDRKKDRTSKLKPLFSLLKQKSYNVKPISKVILNLHNNNDLLIPLNNLLASYIHMLLNRLFKSKQRLHELVVYDFMWRTYRSELAKQKKIINN
jgi:thiopeptide-type bacteriocin biosynthesis protein